MPCSDGPADSATRPSGCWTVSPDPASGRRFSQSPTPAPVPDKRKQNHFHREPRSARRTRDSPLPAPPSAQWPPARNGPFYTATMPCARFPQAPVPASGGRFSPGPIPAPTWDIRTRGHSRRGSPISRRTQDSRIRRRGTGFGPASCGPGRISTRPAACCRQRSLWGALADSSPYPTPLPAPDIGKPDRWSPAALFCRHSRGSRSLRCGYKPGPAIRGLLSTATRSCDGRRGSQFQASEADCAPHPIHSIGSIARTDGRRKQGSVSCPPSSFRPGQAHVPGNEISSYVPFHGPPALLSYSIAACRAMAS